MNQRKDTVAGLMKSAVGKARGLVLRVSHNLNFLHWSARDPYTAPPTTTSEEFVLAAAKFVAEYVMPMAERTYGDAACSPENRNTATLAKWIAKNRPTEVYVRDMQRKVRLPGLTDAKAIHDACKALVEAGWLLPPAKVGFQERKREAYAVSPRLWEALK
jgi:hypothetical protein